MQTHTLRFCEHSITYRIPCGDSCQPVDLRTMLRTPREIADLLGVNLRDQPPHVFGLLTLTAQHRVIGYHEIGRGALNPILEVPREILRTAVLVNAAIIVVARSSVGEPAPAADDLELGKRLADGGSIIGITVLDIVIIGTGKHVSLRASGHL